MITLLNYNTDSFFRLDIYYNRRCTQGQDYREEEVLHPQHSAQASKIE